jgi:hypothetical protein
VQQRHRFTRWIRLKSLATLWAFVCAAVASGQTLKPDNHPNHFIVLVDGSGSAIQTRNKQKNYLHVLREVLPAYLFHSGFGDTAPHYDPTVDALTFERFGIIEGNTSQVFQRLAHADFLGQYIHLVDSAVAHPTQSKFIELTAKPEPHYRYTVLSWCKELGLSNVRSYTRGLQFGRTFMIVVDDGMTNGSDARQEAAETRRWGDPGIIRSTEDIINSIDAAYDFVPVRASSESSAPSRGERFVLQEGSGTDSIFLEVYEVVPKTLKEWQERAVSIAPFASFHSKRSFASDQLLVEGKVSPQLVSWMRSAESKEARLALGPQLETVTPDGPDFTLKVNTRDQCGPTQLSASAYTTLVQHDPVLGERPLQLSYKYTFAVPEPVRCTATWYVQLGTFASVCMAILAGAVVLYRFSCVVLPLTFRIPGHRAIWLRREGVAKLTAEHPPRMGSTAFEFILPPRLVRKSLCRNVQLRISSVQTSEAYVSGLKFEGGKEEISISEYSHNKIVGYWEIAPSQAVRATVLLRNGQQEVVLQVSYPKQSMTMLVDDLTQTGSHGNEHNAKKVSELSSNVGKATHLVALDLGSESMAAYYRVVEGGESSSKMIRLQYYSGRLLRDGNPVLLTDEGGGVSPRLRTRFSLRDNREEACQAELGFINTGRPDQEHYNKSVFEFFRPIGGSLSKSLPNPKIIFQRGAREAIPEVTVVGEDEPKKFLPADVIHWLTVQVVNNFVLGAPELKDVPPNRIELILTVPNVYSVTHVESLRRFVAEHTTVQVVRTIFESDAIAAFATDASENAKGLNIDGGKFYDELVKARKRGLPIELATFDMGRGTTDLSIVTFEEPRRPETEATAPTRWQHFQKARTGRSDGGNKLNYLFVQCFERTVAAVFAEAKAERPYSFISRSGAIPTPQQEAGLQALEAYIEGIKSRISGTYKLSEDNELRGLRSAAADVLGNGANELRELIVHALTLPKRLKNSLWRALVHKLRSVTRDEFERIKDQAHDVLVRSLEAYVEDNVAKLVDDVKVMAEEYEAYGGEKKASSQSAVLGGAKRSTRRFAVIAGRAAQFGPVEQTVLRALYERMQIPRSRVQFLKGERAKECCCRGAVAFYANAIDAMNVDHLHGTYGVSTTGMFEVVPDHIPVWEFRDKGFEKRLPDGVHRFLFSPKPKKNVKDLSEDDSWTTLCTFRGTRMEVHYDPVSMELKLNNFPVVLEPFGEQKMEELYARLWPEFLPGKADLSSDSGSARA